MSSQEEAMSIFSVMAQAALLLCSLKLSQEGS